MIKFRNTKNITVGFYALGCPKNLVDSERMLAQIAQDGFILTADTDNADVVIINTCGFIEPAVNEALETIKYNIELKKEGRIKKIIVAGCLPQRLQKKLTKFEDIDAILSLKFRDDITGIIKKTFSGKNPVTYLAPPPGTPSNDKTRLLLTPGHYAYLRISDGCPYRCSFCTIPQIRGKFRSKPIGNLLSEAHQLASTGVRELILIAQAATSYGRDLKKIKNGLPHLLECLEKIHHIKWIRLMYAYPNDVTDRLIDNIAKSKKILNYLDIPLQHINSSILKNMNRPNSEEKIYHLIEKIKTKIPDIALRTTFIVGFPGETDEQFEKLLDFVKWAEFDNLGCFEFYPEEGTPAADMENQVPDEVKQSRYHRIMRTQQKIAFEKNKSRIGQQIQLLIDSVDDDLNAAARSYAQAPQIDGQCLIKNCSSEPGQFTNARVIDAQKYDLITEQI